MTIALIVLAIVVLIPILYLASLDAGYAVRRSLRFNSGRAKVFNKVRDFETWNDWSPWLMHELGTKLVYSDNPADEGGWYTWDGKMVGAGKLTHSQFIGEDKIEQVIEFTRPFKSICKVWWEFEKVDDGTTVVHWNMAGKMPFLFRFMAKKMPDLIGKDYDTGLYMLRAELEPDAEVPRLTFDGPVDVPQQTGLAIPFAGHLAQMQEAMQEGFPRLGKYVDEHNLTATGVPFTIYHKVDLAKMHFTCDMVLPVPPDTVSAELDVKAFPGGRFYKVTLNGSYEFLELAWYQAYAHLQMLKIKPQHKRASLEAYENDPATVNHSNEIMTSIYIPIR